MHVYLVSHKEVQGFGFDHLYMAALGSAGYYHYAGVKQGEGSCEIAAGRYRPVDVRHDAMLSAIASASQRCRLRDRIARLRRCYQGRGGKL